MIQAVHSSRGVAGQKEPDMDKYPDLEEPRQYTVEDLVRLGNEMLQTMSGVRNVRMIPGCCTQGCCDPAVLDMLGRRPG